MDANAPERDGSGGRTLAVASIVVALFAVVAIASSGSAPTGAVGAQHRPSEGLLDAAVSLLLVVMVVATVLVAVMVSFFGRYTVDGAPRKRRHPAVSMIAFLVTILLLTLVVRRFADRLDPRQRPRTAPGTGAVSGDGTSSPTGYEPHFVVWPVLTVVVLACVAVVAWWLAARGRRATREPPPPTPEEALADVLAETLDDLRSERDPRKAVIAAYARMERTLAASGLPRAPAEAPEEYAERALAELALSRPAAVRLTSLFAWARFSGHDVRPEMKDEAIETLEQVQRELAAAETLRLAELGGTAA